MSSNVSDSLPLTDDDAATDSQWIREAARLTRDLSVARPLIYWLDFSAMVLLGYGMLAVAMFSGQMVLAVPAAVVATFALYRALAFIHELTHLKAGAVPGFRTAWNIVIGIPLMVPSFLYEGVHSLHHSRTRYGTAQDPEYLPLAHMGLGALIGLMVAAALAPLGVIIRFGLLAPLSAFVPSVRKVVVERLSALAIDPAFKREWPSASVMRDWIVWESLAGLWAWGLIAAVGTGALSWSAFLIYLAVFSAIVVLNQIRTLAAHLWENQDGAVSVTTQYLDSVNVPPPGIWAALWAPVGLRYHALHHLLPGMPYHGLGESHRRLTALLPADSPYHQAHYPGLVDLTSRLVRAQRTNGKAVPAR